MVRQRLNGPRRTFDPTTIRRDAQNLTSTFRGRQRQQLTSDCHVDLLVSYASTFASRMRQLRGQPNRTRGSMHGSVFRLTRQVKTMLRAPLQELSTPSRSIHIPNLDWSGDWVSVTILFN